MNLHHTGSKPDWIATPPADQNAWQRLAAATHGTVTPGNVMSVAGFCLVVWGLWTVGDHLLRGAILLGLGRLADIIDGVTAEATATKSPSGEALDATLDKLSALGALAVLAATGIVPLWIAAAILVQNACNAVAGVLARERHVVLHPSRSGKLATAGFWLTIFAFIVAALLLHDADQHAAAWIGYTIGSASLLLGTWSSISYLSSIRSSSHQTTTITKKL